jgi:hypothetical protein
MELRPTVNVTPDKVQVQIPDSFISIFVIQRSRLLSTVRAMQPIQTAVKIAELTQQ